MAVFRFGNAEWPRQLVEGIRLLNAKNGRFQGAMLALLQACSRSVSMAPENPRFEFPDSLSPNLLSGPHCAACAADYFMGAGILSVGYRPRLHALAGSSAVGAGDGGLDELG